MSENQQRVKSAKPNCSVRGSKLHPRRTLQFATWNIRTLVENAGGDRRICRTRPTSLRTPVVNNGSHQVDRKVDLLVKELRRYRVGVAGMQETKWFGKDVWEIDGYTLLHSGQQLPDGQQ